MLGVLTTVTGTTKALQGFEPNKDKTNEDKTNEDKTNEDKINEEEK